MLLLTDADVRALLPMPRAIEAMRDAFAALAAGDAAVPVRTAMPGAGGARVLVMPAALGGLVTVKTVTVRPPDDELPTTAATLLAVDAATGAPRALFAAEALTAIRTGAASGLATELLAAPGASTLALLGAGAQAATQADAVCAVRPIERVLVFGRDPARAAAFAEATAARLGVEAWAERDPARLAEAEVVCTATTSASPVFDAAHLAPGAHVNAVGAYRPGTAEVPPAAVRAAAVVVDHRAAALAEAGDLLSAFDTREAAAAHVRAELGELVRGTAPGRLRPDETTLFKSVGVGVQDAAAAAVVLAAAEARGVGARVEL